MPKRLGLLTGILTMVIYSSVAAAATQYVSDQLSINMRSGPGTSYRIEQLLDAGDKVQTLSESNGWTKVQTSDGKTGFVLTRYLSDQPAARTRIDAMQKQDQQLKTENANLKSELADAQSGSKKLGEAKQNLASENATLKANLQHLKETSADAIRISNENQKYREQLMSLRSDVDRLRHENQALQSRREGMKIGALILIAGIIVGLMLPLFRRRRKGSWDSL